MIETACLRAVCAGFCLSLDAGQGIERGASFVAAEFPRWEKVVRDAGLQPE